MLPQPQWFPAAALTLTGSPLVSHTMLSLEGPFNPLSQRHCMISICTHLKQKYQQVNTKSRSTLPVWHDGVPSPEYEMPPIVLPHYTNIINDLMIYKSKFYKATFLWNTLPFPCVSGISTLFISVEVYVSFHTPFWITLSVGTVGCQNDNIPYHQRLSTVVILTFNSQCYFRNFWVWHLELRWSKKHHT